MEKNETPFIIHRRKTLQSKDSIAISESEKKAISDFVSGENSPEVQFKLWQMKQKG